MINNTISGYFSPNSFGNAQTTPNSLLKSKPLTGAISLNPPQTASVSPVNPPAQTTPQPNYSAPVAQPYTPPATTPTPTVAVSTPPTQPTQSQQPDTNSFKGLVSTTANTALAGSPTAQDYTRRAVEYGAGSIPIAQQANDIAKQFGEEFAQLGQKRAVYDNPLQFSPGLTQVVKGNAGINAGILAGQQQAAAQGEQAALQGIGYELTGQNQAANAANSAAGQAYTGQGQTLSALGTAAGLAQPNVAAYGNTVFNPLTGQYEGGGGLPNEVMQQYAQMAANGQISGIPSSITSNPVLSAQLNAAAKAINPNYSPITSAASGASAADLVSQKANLESVFKGADANFQLALNTAKQGGVNDMNIPALNQLQQNVQRGLTSNQSVINFQNTIKTVRAAYAQILGGGTATVDSNNRAAQAIPDTISLNALQSLSEQIKAESTNRIRGIDEQIGTLQGGAGTTGGGGSSSDPLGIL